MDMPPPMTKKTYYQLNNLLHQAQESVAEESTKRAGSEIHDLSPDTAEIIKDCQVSVDGTWQKRGYSSLNGVVTALSSKDGKCLEIAVNSAVIDFNDGQLVLCKVAEQLGLQSGKFMKRLCFNEDSSRIKESTRKSTEKTKKGRKKLRAKEKDLLIKNKKRRQNLPMFLDHFSITVALKYIQTLTSIFSTLSAWS